MRFFLLVFALCSIFQKSLAQNNPEPLVTNRLSEKMLKAGEDEYLPVVILMRDRVDVQGLNKKFTQNKTDLKTRASQTITSLHKKAESSQAALLQYLNAAPGVDKKSVQGYWVVNLIYAGLQKKTIRALMSRGDIESLDLEANVRPVDSFTPSAAPNTGRAKGKPEVGLVAIGAPFMWQKGYTGYGRKAAIIDSGADGWHKALKNQYWGNNVNDTLAAYNTINDNIFFDCLGHGTHVTGTICGIDRSNADTIGVAFNANWMISPHICGADIDIITQDVIKSFQWLIDPDHDPNTVDDMPDAINNSWQLPGMEECDQAAAFRDLFTALESAGIAIVFAAGNSGPTAQTVIFPQSLNMDITNAFSVGAVDGSKANLPITDFSSRGPSRCTESDTSLYIKPEVSAPGLEVRSSIPGNAFGNNSGTSMASPHVTGAVILLKEAFPYLPGSEIKKALYFSAIPKGIGRENNDYGMGVINLQNAYQYLVDQGNTPVDPLKPKIDALLVNVEPASYGCGLENNIAVSVSNEGSEPIHNIKVVYDVYNAKDDAYISTDSFTVVQEVAVAGLFTYNQKITNLPAGDYLFRYSIKEVNGEADERSLNNKLRVKVNIADLENIKAELVGDTSLCVGSKAFLKYVSPELTGFPSNTSIYWYSTKELITPLNGKSANEFLLPNITPAGTKNYYVQLRSIDTVGIRTPSSNKLESFGLQKLRFTVTSKIRLNGVSMFATGSGSTYIYLSGTDLYKPIELKAGENKISVGWDIAPGQYELTLLFPASTGLYYDTSNVAFPYDIPGIVSLTGGSDENGQPAYPYFYNMSITYNYPCDPGVVTLNVRDIKSAKVKIATNPSPAATKPGKDVTFNVTTDTTLAGANWVFGDGVESPDLSAVHQYDNEGRYNVRVFVKDENGCATLDTVNVLVSNLIGTADNKLNIPVDVYPNPASDILYVETGKDIRSAITGEILGVTGSKVMESFKIQPGAKVPVSIKTLPSGTYILKLTSEGRSDYKKITIIR